MEPSTGGFRTTRSGLRAWIHGDTAGGSACTSIPSHAHTHTHLLYLNRLCSGKRSDGAGRLGEPDE